MINRRMLVRYLEEVGRIRLSDNFFLRDFLHSEIASAYGIVNMPDDVELAVSAGRRLCSDLLEPLNAAFGSICIRSGYRSRELNATGNRLRLGCASNARNYAGHIWDAFDDDGRMGATATIVIPWFVRQHEQGADWRSLAWWIHDNLPYSSLCFYPKLAAFNIQWHELPKRTITSWARPIGILTQPGMENHVGTHQREYEALGFPAGSGSGGQA